MNWMRPAIILLAIAIALPATESAGSQDSPAVAAARQLFGDYKVIPGERIGAVRLGEASRDDYRSRFGLNSTYGFRPPPAAMWDWPTKNTARREDITWDQPFEFFFCPSNRRLFAAAVFNAGSWYPDHQMFWLFMQRLITPEGLRGGHWVSSYHKYYGPPVATLGTDGGWKKSLFRNGLYLYESDPSSRPVFIGVYNLGICRDEPIRGVYVPHFRHVTVNRAFLSKSGNLSNGEIGPPIAEAKLGLRERAYAAIELSFPAWDADQSVRFFRVLRSPDGSGTTATFNGVVKAGETNATIVFHVHPTLPRTAGAWKVEFHGPSYPSLLATLDFEAD